MPVPIALSLVWFFALGGLGLIFPYYTLYLSENAGLEGAQVGLVMATLPFVGLMAQPFWGQVADRTGLRTRVVTAVLAGTAVGYALLSRADSFVAFLLLTSALALFSTALVPNCVAVTLALLPDGGGFGKARAMGTLGFGVSVATFPFVLQGSRSAGYFPPITGSGVETGLELIFGLSAVLVGAAALVSLGLPGRGRLPAPRARTGEWRQLFRSVPFRRALAFAFLAFLINQGPMVLFPILVRDQGGGVDAIGRMWVLMLALEVPLVYHFGATLSRFGRRGIVTIGVAAASLRWAVSGFGEDLTWVYAAQLLHGVTVWGIVLGLPLYVDAVVPAQLRSTGQGLLAMLGVSLGSMLSNLGTGWIMQVWGPRAPAQIASLAGVGLLLALPWLLLPTTPGSEVAEEEPGDRGLAPATATLSDSRPARGGAGAPTRVRHTPPGAPRRAPDPQRPASPAAGRDGSPR